MPLHSHCTSIEDFTAKAVSNVIHVRDARYEIVITRSIETCVKTVYRPKITWKSERLGISDLSILITTEHTNLENPKLYSDEWAIARAAKFTAKALTTLEDDTLHTYTKKHSEYEGYSDNANLWKLSTLVTCIIVLTSNCFVNWNIWSAQRCFALRLLRTWNGYYNQQWKLGEELILLA